MDILHNIYRAQIEIVYGSLAEDLQEVVDVLTMDPAGNSTMWGMIEMAYNIILPVGLMIAATFAMMTILEKAILFKTHNVESVAKLLLLFIFGKILLDNSFELMGWIYQVVAALIYDLGTIPNMGVSDADIDALATALGAMSWSERMMTQIRLMPSSIIMGLLKLAIKIIAYGRLIELYVYLAVAPIPLATLVSETHVGIAKRFLQGYLAACLQGLIMLLAIMLYSALEVQIRYPITAEGMQSGNMSFLLPALVLCMVLIKSGSWAKTVTGLI